MAQVLKLTKLGKYNGMAQMQVGRCWVETKFDAKRSLRRMGAQELLLKLGLHKNFITAPANNGHGLLDLGG